MRSSPEFAFYQESEMMQELTKLSVNDPIIYCSSYGFSRRIQMLRYRTV